MGEIVNLRRARKAKERRKDEARAEENRVRFGVSKADRQLADKTRAQAERRLEGHRLDLSCERSAHAGANAQNDPADDER